MSSCDDPFCKVVKSVLASIFTHLTAIKEKEGTPTNKGEWDLSISKSRNKLKNKKHKQIDDILNRLVFSFNHDCCFSFFLGYNTFISIYLISFCSTNRRSWWPTGRSIHDMQHIFLIMQYVYYATQAHMMGCCMPFLTCWVENIFHHMDHAICSHQITLGNLHWVDTDRIIFLWGKEKKKSNLEKNYFL